MKIDEFIEDIFIGEYGQIVKHHKYISFMLIFNSIELLGKCLDDKNEFEYDAPGYYKNCFETAIYKLFDKKYHNLRLVLYCRNGFAHMGKPKKYTKIKLSQRNGKKCKHPASIKGSNISVLFAEDFYEDFKTACEKIIIKIRNNEFSHKKFKEDFLPVKKNYELK
jgi:hypothetical protein